MAKNREKQRAHLNCGMTKEQRLAMEAEEKALEQTADAEESVALRDYCGVKDPTPYKAFRNIDRRTRRGVIYAAS